MASSTPASPVPVLFIDAEAVVIDKPAGLCCAQPRRGGASVEAMLSDLRFGFGRPPMLIHRLDTDTSGCLLLARNPKAAKRFSAAFEARQVAKTYIGITDGVPEEEAGEIDLPIAKISNPDSGWRMVADPQRTDRKAKAARTAWRRLADHDGRALILFTPETGRTHQLRVHAASGLGMALSGDPQYGAGEQSASRLMLHALGLVVPRANKPAIDAFAPVPAAFSDMGFADAIAKLSENGMEVPHG